MKIKEKSSVKIPRSLHAKMKIIAGRDKIENVYIEAIEDYVNKMHSVIVNTPSKKQVIK